MSKQTADNKDIFCDSKYKNYVSQVERALKAFESTSEWADLISALGKLIKVLNAHNRYSVIPKKTLIGKRLAQCLHPSLPSGVHLKALETYDIIFKSIGPSELAVDIFTYCSGLFPLLGYAAINVRPMLLQIYEVYLLSLGHSIKPAMTGLILSLLPGLENGSEFYNRTYQLLESFCNNVEKSYFYCCMWECISVNATIRHSGLTYILMHFDKKQSMEDQIFLMGTSLDLLVEGLCLSLEDNSSLVQRCSLDLLISCFPIQKCQLPKSDTVKVLMCAITVLLRRDMSLNRRLYAWLMGTDLNGMPATSSLQHNLSNEKDLQKTQDFSYFEMHSKKLLTLAIRNILRSENDFYNQKRGSLLSLKIVISLLDRPEIISPILNDLLLDILRLMYRECVTQLPQNIKVLVKDKVCFNSLLSDESFSFKLKNEERTAMIEIYKTANILFGKFDPHFIWAFLAGIFDSACNCFLQSISHADSISSIKEFCDITNFLLDKLSVETYVGTQTEHFPKFLFHVISVLSKNIDSLQNEDIISVLSLCSKMFSGTLSCIGMLLDYSRNSLRSTRMEPDRTSIKKVEKRESIGQDQNGEKLTDFEIINREEVGQSQSAAKQEESSMPDTAKESGRSHQALLKGLTAQNHVFSFIKGCLELFREIVNKRVIMNTAVEASCMNYLFSFTNKNGSWSEFQKAISCLLVSSGSDLKSQEELFECACQLLEKSLLFPGYDVSFDSLDIPGWFQSLVVCSVATCFNFQYVALKCIFNLVESWQRTCKDPTYFSADESRPIFHRKDYLQVLSHKTCFYKIVASSVWKYMSRCDSNLSIKSVEMLNRIHQNAPYSWICEDVISHELLSSDQNERLNASVQFMSFWHSLKELEGVKSQLFEKSIMILLSNLDSPSLMFSSLSKMWVISCIKSEDLVIILEPVLKVLLHPDTARISVQHLDSNNLKQIVSDSLKNSNVKEAKVVAVSNEGGNIIYHVDNHKKYKPTRDLSAEEFQALIFTTVSEQGSSTTKRASVLLDNYPSNSMAVQQSSVTLHVNPFGANSSDDDDRSNPVSLNNVDHHDISSRAKRLNMKTCLEEEICFDESQFFPNSSDSIHVKNQIVSEIIDEILHNVVYNSRSVKTKTKHNKNFVEQDSENPEKERDAGNDPEIHLPICKDKIHEKGNGDSLKSFVLYYFKQYDYSRIICALKLFENILAIDPMLVINSLLNRNLKVHFKKLEDFDVIDLFLRHKQSILGHNFHSSMSFDVADNLNGTSYLELVIFILLYFLRSYFNQKLIKMLRLDEEYRNSEVRISCCRLLQFLFTEITKLLQNNSKSAYRVSDILLKSKVQKTVLYSIYSNLKKSAESPDKSESKSNLFEMYQDALLTLTISLVQLEDQIRSLKGELINDFLPKEFEQTDLLGDRASSIKVEALFLTGHPIVYQPILLEAVIYSLKCLNDEKLHMLWINFVYTLMPYFSKASIKILTTVVLQLCYNMENCEKTFLIKSSGEFCLDHYISLFKSLTSIYHYCLFEAMDYKNLNVQPTDVGKMLQTFSGQFISGLASALSFQASAKGRKFNSSVAQEESLNSVNMCSYMLDLLPSISDTMVNAWKFAGQVANMCNKKSPKMITNWSNKVKQCVLDFLNPVIANFTHSLLASFALIWNSKFTFGSYEFMVNPTASEDQFVLVEILKEMKNISLNSLTVSIRQMVKQPNNLPASFNKCKYLSLEGGLLQMFFIYCKQLPSNVFVDSIGLFITFLKECYQSNLDSSAVFVLLSILHFVLQKGPIFDEKKEHKGIHEITHKLLESCSNIAGLSLEPTYFFKRYLAVREDFSLEDGRSDDLRSIDAQSFETSLSGSQLSRNIGTSTFSQSVQALYVLAEVTATLLDVVFQSDEKDKVTPLLTNILSYVFPYLRNHKLSNVPSYTASSKLIANLSSYQYTRKSWKKECFDLLLDPNFFQMNLKSLKYWIITIDNLMTHDKSTFLDLLARFSLAQSSSLNLFSSREAEAEMKTQLLKRLSFTVFCSEMNQYQKHIPDIQEKLFDCLRSHNSPRLYAEIFNCFRVLVLRMSSFSLASLWPTMMAELIQVFINIEQKLKIPESEDSPRTYKTTDSLVHAGCDRDNNLYLAACKLLDLFLALPSENLPQFQLYKWAFVADAHTAQPFEFTSRVKESALGFVPHALKIARLMTIKFGQAAPNVKVPNRLVIHCNKISTIRELHDFFATICRDSGEASQMNHDPINYKILALDKSQSYPNIYLPNLKSAESSGSEDLNPLELIESVAMNDFLENLS